MVYSLLFWIEINFLNSNIKTPLKGCMANRSDKQPTIYRAMCIKKRVEGSFLVYSSLTGI